MANSYSGENTEHGRKVKELRIVIDRIAANGYKLNLKKLKKG